MGPVVLMKPAGDFDTIIIGGGPGGSTAGALLARAGQRVLILEKETFPRFHIGESLLPFGNAVLEESGAWEKVRAAGFMPKHGTEFMVGNASLFHRFWFRDGLFPEFSQAFQVERSKFDDLLLRHAAECGCDVRQNTAATRVELDESGARVTFAGQTTRARWLLDASGRDTFVGRALNLPKEQLDLPKRIAVFAHYEGVFRNDGEAAGHISIVRLADGWFWLIPLDGRKTSVGMVCSLAGFKAAGGDAADCFEQTVAGSRELRPRLQLARRVGEFHTTSDYTYSYATLAGPRFLLIGDAGAFIDPIFSSGVFIATKTGAMASRLILHADARHRALTAREQNGYTREVHRIRNIYLQMIRTFYDNDSFAVFMHPVSGFRLVATINSILAGNTQQRFGMWWRVQLFHLVCRLQQRVNMVEPLNFAEEETVPAVS